MKQFTPFILSLLLLLSACEKWQDKPAKDLGLTDKYCNIPGAINYNVGFPGVEDNSTCIYPSEPLIGNYSFRDSIYDEANTLIQGDSIDFSISKIDSTRIQINHFCASGNSFRFVCNRYMRAESDSIIGQGSQLMCRSEDTLTGTLNYRSSDSSLYIDWRVISDTGSNTHMGRAYKK